MVFRVLRKQSSAFPFGSRVYRSGVVGLLALVGMVILAPVFAEARHQTKYDYVPAMSECLAGAADTMVGPLPACSNPQPISNCGTDPATALKLGPRARARFMQFSTGRRKSISIGQQINVLAKFKAKDILRCDGSPSTGDLTLRVHYRLTLADDACTGSLCTVPDSSFDYTIPCSQGTCQLKERFVNNILVAQGKLPFPQRPWWGEVHSVDLLDLAGRPLLTHGIVAPGGSSTMAINAPRSKLFSANYVDAFAECISGTETFTSTDGFPACAGQPTSDCTSNPTEAIKFGLRPEPETAGGSRHGKLKLSARSRNGGSDVSVRGRMATVRDCLDAKYEGPLTLLLRLRLTCYGSACGPTGSTVVDTDIPLLVSKPSSFSFSLDAAVISAGLPTLGSLAPAILDIRSAQVLDVGGTVFATLSGMRVACTPASGNTVCFGL